MRIKALLVLVAMMSGMSFPASAFQVLINTESGALTYNSDELRSVRLLVDGGALLTLTDGNTVSLSGDEFRSLGFGSNSSLISISEDELPINISHNKVILGEGMSATIADASGRTLATTSDGTIDLTCFSPGVYVISSGSKTVKILVK